MCDARRLPSLDNVRGVEILVFFFDNVTAPGQGLAKRTSLRRILRYINSKPYESQIELDSDSTEELWDLIKRQS
jgi:hypothetical protein